MSTPILGFVRAIKNIAQYSIFLSFLFLLGCLDLSNTDSTNATSSSAYSDTKIEGQAVNSVIEKGIVRSYQIVHSEEGSTISTVPFGLPIRTDKNGFFSFNIPNDIQTDSILISITADEATQMTCDVVSGCTTKNSEEKVAFGNTFLLDNSFEITGMMPTLDHGFTNIVTVNPLTHLAASFAKSQEAGPTIENINTSYRYIENIFGFSTRALQLPTPDLTKLDEQTEISQPAMKVAILSTSFLALLNSPDWASISEIIHHAANRISISGTIAAANMGALPEVSLDNLFYQAGETAVALLTKTDNSIKQNTLNIISLEVKESYELTMIVPEIITTIEIEEHPTSAEVNEGLSANFMVAASGDDLSYQWRLNNVPINGANDAAYIINKTSVENAGTYDVIVSNLLGSQVSLSALLTVLPLEIIDSEQTHNGNDLPSDNENDQPTDNGNEQPADSGNELPTNNGNELPTNNGNELPTDNGNELPTDNGNELPTDNGNEAPTDNGNEVPTDNGNEVPTDNGNEVQTDNGNELPTDNGNEAPTDNGNEVPTDNGNEVPTDNGNEVPTDNGNEAPTDNGNEAPTDNGNEVPTDNGNEVPQNTPPTAQNDTIEIFEDTPTIIHALENDSDLDSDLLTITHAVVTNGPGNVLIQNIVTDDGQPFNALLFTPEQDSNSSSTISYTISDGHNNNANALVNLQIFPINDTPKSFPDVAEMDEDTKITLDVLANDYDADNDTLTISSASSALGTVDINPDNTITFEAISNFTGIAEINYITLDGHGGITAGIATITVININDLPVAINDTAETIEDSTVNINVLSNDFDEDFDELKVTSASSSKGQVSINPDNTLTFTPAENINGSALIIYTISDEKGGTSSAEVNVFILAVNDAPDLSNDTIQTNEDTSVIINVLDNDNDADNDVLTVTDAHTTTPGGMVSLNRDNTLTFVPVSDFNGEVNLFYTVNDNHGSIASASVTVIINPVNDLPVAINDTAETTEDSAITIQVLSNDFVGDFGELKVTFASSSKGQVSINTDNTLTFIPTENVNGSALISYTISDEKGSTSSAEVNVSILAVNDAPDLSNDTVQTNEDTSVVIKILDNDSDADNDVLTVTDAHTTTPGGMVSLNKDNTLTFVPVSDFNGEVNLSYTVTDSHGSIESASVTVIINPINDLPVAINDTAETIEDSAITINVLNNDFDGDFDELKVTFASSSKGRITINTDNTLLFTPTENVNGSALITYTISDEKGGTSSAEVNVSILAVNDAPDLSNDTVQTNEDTPVIINILDNDNDVDNDALTVTDVHTITPGGMVSLNRDNTLTFVPVSNFNGEVNLSYTVNDSHGSIANASVTVIINPINDLPILADHQIATKQEAEITIDALVGAYDLDGDTLNLIASTALNGNVTLNDNQSIIYQPASGFSGEDIITYTVSDGKGGISNAMITVFVSAIQKFYSIELDWERPTKRDDDTLLYASDIKGYAIKYGLDSSQFDSSVFVNDASSITYVIYDLTPGIYYFAIATVTKDDIQGDYSENIAISIGQ